MNTTEHERNLIASILRHNDQFINIRPQLKTEHFSNPLFAKTYGRMLELSERELPVDFLSVTNSGAFSDSEKNKLWDIYSDDKAGGHPLIFFHHVLNGFLSRERDEFIKRLSSDSFEPFDHVETVAAYLAKAENTLATHTVMSRGQMLDEYQTHLDQSINGGGQRIPTPWIGLNDALNGGIGIGDYVLIGGTPGSGKTSAMLAMAMHAATENHHVAFITGEMTRNELLERIEGIHTGLDINEEIKKGTHPAEHASFMRSFSTLPFNIISNYDNSEASLRRSIGLALNDGASLIFIDYLQKFAPTTKKDDEHVIIKNVSGWLRNIPLKHNIGLVVASSINRDGQKNQEDLSLASFYGSSMLGHDCTTGILLSSVTDPKTDQSEMVGGQRTVKLQIVKNRAGIRGTVMLNFQLRCQRLEQLLTHPKANSKVISFGR